VAGRDAGHAGALNDMDGKALLRAAWLAATVAALSGCAVVSVASATVSVASTAVSVGAGAVGLAADAAIGTARITGKAVGAAADAVLPSAEAP